MKLREILTGNWWLRILALVLAVILYHAVKQTIAGGPSDKNDRHFQTP